MLTPFDQNKNIDWNAVSVLTEYYLRNDIAGLFAVCGSSEMFKLSWSEKLKTAKKIIKVVNGSVPVIVSGIHSATKDEQTDMIKEMYDLGANAVILLVNQYAEENESDDMWKLNMEFLLYKTNEIPLGLYECPAPYHRLMSPILTKWAAETGRFIWMKETSDSIEILQSKINAVATTKLKIYNADSRIQNRALHSGVSGYSGIATNFYPDLLNWMNNNYLTEPILSAELQRFFINTHSIINNKYLASAKYYAKLSKVPIDSICRESDLTLTENDKNQLADLQNRQRIWQEKLNLKSRRN